jgi:5-deoxy-glucuronate isomerase
MTLLRLAGPAGSDGQVVGVTPTDAGWRYVHFSAHRLAAGAIHAGETGGCEAALIVLGGRCRVRAGADSFAEIGARPDVWARVPPDVVLLPPGVGYEVEATTDLHLAVAAAPAEAGCPARLIRGAEIVREERGEGQTRRVVHHLLPPSADAARLILVEVYTPGGNWSSFPPHKHDTEAPPEESYLEETYYHLVDPPTGFCLQRVYSPDGILDETLAVHDGDLVLVPRGYHPVVATPGHESYYLNVMAGPSRAWNFRVDPAYQALMNWRKPAVAQGGASA